MYTAVIRRQAGGLGTKVAKRGGGDLFIVDTSRANLQTFFQSWPRHLTTYLCYGRSVRSELSYPGVARPLQLGGSGRRGYGHLAEQAELAEALAISSSPGWAHSALLPESESSAKRPLLGGAVMNQQQRQQQPKPTAQPTPIAAKPRPKVTLHTLRLKHTRLQPISMVTAYDYPSARLADAAGVDMLLVGDSLGMVVLGQQDTTEVTMDEMIHHCKAVHAACRRLTSFLHKATTRRHLLRHPLLLLTSLCALCP